MQAALRKDISMRLPPGCGELSAKIMRLLTCQYGLKQAGREWHMLLINWLVEEIGLEQCKAEPYSFWLIVSGGKNACEKFFAQLKEQFPVKKQGGLKMYTGRAFVRVWKPSVLKMDQTAYICGKPGSVVWNLRNLEHPR